MQNYVSILPNDTEHVRDAEPSGSKNAELKRRRVGVSIACNACRRKKVRCDGQRPICSSCDSKATHCSYRDDSEISQESQTLLLEVFRLLSAIPDQEVLDRVRGLKDEVDVSVILSRLRGDDAAEKHSDTSLPIPAMSEQFRLMELGPQYPNAYPVIPSLDLDTLEGVAYQQLVQSIPHHAASGHSLPLCDARLGKLEIGNWTDVPITNQVAARAISIYLETDHPLLGYFDPALFVSDLVAAKTDYCSRILVNALMYWACQLNSVQDPESWSLALQFCSEAESLWKQERDVDSILNLAAALFLSLGYLGQGRDHVILFYLNAASDMAVRMGLFGVQGDDIQLDMDLMPAPSRSAHLHAAWGAFNWITHMSLLYRQPGLQCPRCPPPLPSPGMDNATTMYDADKVDPSQGTCQAPYMGGVFPYICQFWTILHELAFMYRDKGPLAGDGRTLCFAEYKFRELLAWSNRLPSTLSRSDSSPHYVQILHIWFHAAVLDLFRFSMSGPLKDSPLRTFTNRFSSPENVCIASARQLKQLVINYRLNFTSSYTILWHTALTYLANAILHYPKEDNWFFYFLLCVYGYERLQPCWRVTQVISTALLSMALRKGDISSPTARRVLRDVDHGRLDDIPGEVRATFMMDLDLAASDPDAATVEKMAEDFDLNMLLQQYTNIFDRDGGAKGSAT
ncbi:N-terminal fungal transcription regulatory domain-containing protein, partial [Metarhizium majus ARSEF 297]